MHIYYRHAISLPPLSSTSCKYNYCIRYLRVTSDLELRALLHRSAGVHSMILKNYKRAVVHNQSVCSIYHRIHGAKHPLSIMSITSLADSLSALGKDLEALNLYTQALKSKTEIYGATSSITSEAHMRVGTCLLKLNDAANALIHFEKAQEINSRLKKRSYIKHLMSVNHQNIVLAKKIANDIH